MEYKNNKLGIAFFLIVLFLGFPYSFAKEQPLTPEKLFIDDPISRFTILPNGKYIAYVSPQQVTDLVSIMDLDTNKLTFSFQMGSNKFVGRLLWANNTRLIIQPAKKISFREQLYYTGTLQAINFDGSKNSLLYGYQGSFKGSNNKSSDDYFDLISTIPNDEEHIILQTSKENSQKSTKRLVRLNIYSGRILNRDLSSVNNADFLVNMDGEAIAQSCTTEKFENILEYKDIHDEWQGFYSKDEFELISDAPNNGLYLSLKNEEGVESIVEFSRVDKSIKVLAKLEKLDRSYKYFDENTGRLIAFKLTKGHPDLIFLDAKSEASIFYQDLIKHFKGSFARVVASSNDGKRKVIAVNGDREPGLYYLFEAGKLQQLTKALLAFMIYHLSLRRAIFTI